MNLLARLLTLERRRPGAVIGTTDGDGAPVRVDGETMSRGEFERRYADRPRLLRVYLRGGDE